MEAIFILILIIVIVLFCIINSSAKKSKRNDIIEAYCKKHNITVIETSPNKKAFAAYSNSQNKIVLGVVCYDDINEKVFSNFNLSNNLDHYYNVWNFFAFDNEKNNMLIANINTSKSDIQAKLITYSDIIGVEILEDNVAVSSKSTSRTVGGALIGGALGGVAGSVVGGLSGSNATNNKIQSLALKILVRDMKNPSIIIKWFKWTDKGIEKSAIKDSFYDPLCKVKDTISVIIDKVDAESRAAITNSSTKSPSTADEILKLVKLRDIGVITEAEFEQQKKVLLS